MDGAPLAYACRGFAFHLEVLGLADGEGLAKACERIAAIHGDKLKWGYSSVHAEVERFAPDVLDLVSAFPAQMRLKDPKLSAGALAMEAAHYDRFGVACHGGAKRNDGSPSTFRFFASVAPASPVLRADAMIAATFPASMPDEELASLATNVAADLRIRWGAAGLAFGAWELDRYGATRDALFAHARRHPGFDLGQHSTWMRAFHDRLRTVSWLTFVGPALAAKLSPPALKGDDIVTVTKKGETYVFQAGAAPASGDVNRDEFPHAYVEVDRRLREVRAEGIHFYAPWTSASSERWLRRFEK
jgi:hypothetical protein